MGTLPAVRACSWEVAGDFHVVTTMLPALIFFAGLVWLVAALIAFSMCAVARRSDDAVAQIVRDPRLG